MNKEDIGKHVSQFISKNFLFDEQKSVKEDISLLQTGVLDSTGILELISFLETTFQLTFQDHELVADNFDSIAKIKSFIARKMSNHSR